MPSTYSAWTLADTIGHVFALLGSVIEEQVLAYKLTRAQALALGVLADMDDGISQAEWARLQGVTRQHVHAIARRLQEEGWIVAKRAGRERIVSLPKSRQRKIAALRPEMDTQLQTAFGGLTQKDQRVLNTLLAKLVDSFGRSAQS